MEAFSLALLTGFKAGFGHALAYSALCENLLFKNFNLTIEQEIRCPKNRYLQHPLKFILAYHPHSQLHRLVELAAGFASCYDDRCLFAD